MDTPLRSRSAPVTPSASPRSPLPIRARALSVSSLPTYVKAVMVAPSELTEEAINQVRENVQKVVAQRDIVIVMDEGDPARYRVDIRRQGDLQMYEEEQLIKRAKMRESEDLKEIIENLWYDLPRREGKYLTFVVYAWLYKTLFFQIVPGGTKSECDSLTKLEWESEAREFQTCMTKAEFLEAMFKLVDIWCNGDTEEDYITFFCPIMKFARRQLRIEGGWKIDEESRQQHDEAARKFDQFWESGLLNDQKGLVANAYSVWKDFTFGGKKASETQIAGIEDQESVNYEEVKKYWTEEEEASAKETASHATSSKKSGSIKPTESLRSSSHRSSERRSQQPASPLSPVKSPMTPYTEGSHSPKSSFHVAGDKSGFRTQRFIEFDGDPPQSMVDDVDKAHANLLRRCDSYRSLNLDNREIYSRECDAIGARASEAMMEMLGLGRDLKALRLEQGGLNTLAPFLPILMLNEGISFLSVKNNHLPEKEIALLSRAMSQMQQLKAADISRNDEVVSERISNEIGSMVEASSLLKFNCNGTLDLKTKQKVLNSTSYRQHKGNVDVIQLRQLRQLMMLNSNGLVVLNARMAKLDSENETTVASKWKSAVQKCSIVRALDAMSEDQNSDGDGHTTFDRYAILQAKKKLVRQLLVFKGVQAAGHDPTPRVVKIITSHTMSNQPVGQATMVDILRALHPTMSQPVAAKFIKELYEETGWEEIMAASPRSSLSPSMGMTSPSSFGGSPTSGFSSMDFQGRGTPPYSPHLVTLGDAASAMPGGHSPLGMSLGSGNQTSQGAMRIGNWDVLSRKSSVFGKFASRVRKGLYDEQQDSARLTTPSSYSVTNLTSGGSVSAKRVVTPRRTSPREDAATVSPRPATGPNPVTSSSSWSTVGNLLLRSGSKADILASRSGPAASQANRQPAIQAPKEFVFAAAQTATPRTGDSGSTGSAKAPPMQVQQPKELVFGTPSLSLASPRSSSTAASTPKESSKPTSEAKQEAKNSSPQLGPTRKWAPGPTKDSGTEHSRHTETGNTGKSRTGNFGKPRTNTVKEPEARGVADMIRKKRLQMDPGLVCTSPLGGQPTPQFGQSEASPASKPKPRTRSDLPPERVRATESGSISATPSSKTKSSTRSSLSPEKGATESGSHLVTPGSKIKSSTRSSLSPEKRATESGSHSDTPTTKLKSRTTSNCSPSNIRAAAWGDSDTPTSKLKSRTTSNFSPSNIRAAAWGDSAQLKEIESLVDSDPAIAGEASLRSHLKDALLAAKSLTLDNIGPQLRRNPKGPKTLKNPMKREMIKKSLSKP